ncbi:hypothetical protein T12_1484 [Trichinella patagoniensis]|uniref:Uncharacterized protein n=1 Tax=Trichinella patagoniensis TaxID=990121 RepID=A0A0V0YUL2_9BILA|nr:hypothetical protein T12_1484 [Trichinella patagoniensis]
MAFNFILNLAGRILLSIHIEVEYPTYVSRCLTLRAQCLSFMQIGPFEN